MSRRSSAGWFRRWLHTRGFGIHSPSAYSFVTTIVRSPYAYYADGQMGSQAERVLHRMAARIPFRGVCYSSGAGPAFRKAVSLADSRLPEVSAASGQEGRVLAVVGPDVSDRMMQPLLSGIENVIFFTGTRGLELDGMCDGLRKGFLLKGRTRAILVTTDRPEFVAYDINL